MVSYEIPFFRYSDCRVDATIRRRHRVRKLHVHRSLTVCLMPPRWARSGRAGEGFIFLELVKRARIGPPLIAL